MLTIPPHLLERPAEGYNLPSPPAPLGELLGDRPTLLVFLRHFGWIFCRETVKDLRAAVAADSTYPPLIFVYQGTPLDGEAFFAYYWPEARAIADGDGLPLYRALGLERGTAKQLMNMGVLACSIRAAAKGNMQGKPVGDQRQMPGLFLVQGERILWQHDYAHAGDSPDWAALPQQLVKL